MCRDKETKLKIFHWASLLGALLGSLLACNVRAQNLYVPYYYDSTVPHQDAYPMTATQPMYSYSYDPNLDTHKTPYVAPPAHQSANDLFQEISLSTPSGLTGGFQITDYDYKEPGLDELSGPKAGLTLNGAGKFDNGFFLGVKMRYALGWSDYNGSGTSSGHFENLFDVRPYLGKDFVFSTFSLSPYLGVGYRHLYSNDRGVTSTGDLGYRRTNNLIYLPFGVTPRFRVTDESLISTNLEYDAVLSGIEMTKLSDVDPGLPGVHNQQSSGYGLRADVMWEHQDWGVGPFLIYWNIDQSNSVCASGSVYSGCGFYEPANSTLEGGLQLTYHFF